MHLSGVKFGELNCSRLTGFEFSKATQSCKPTSEGQGLQITITQKKTRAENFSRATSNASGAIGTTRAANDQDSYVEEGLALGVVGYPPWPSECFSVE
jgi:hypothetical protein